MASTTLLNSDIVAPPLALAVFIGPLKDNVAIKTIAQAVLAINFINSYQNTKLMVAGIKLPTVIMVMMTELLLNLSSENL